MSRWRGFRGDVVPSEGDDKERGATLVIASMLMLVLMGMAGFAVDLGWLYLKTTEAQKAAEASALAGVVHMPNPGNISWGAGAEGWDAAIDVAGRNGYTPGGGTTISPKEVPGFPNQIEVEIATTVPTFFMRIFGVNSVSFDRAAIAEHLPPLKLGSDEPFLGQDPDDPARDTDYWISINGTYTGKNEGDPFSTKCYWGVGSPTPSPPYATAYPGGCAETGNYQYRDPAYWYAINVPASEAGQSMVFQVYDGPFSQPNTTTKDWHYKYDVIPYVTTFRLLAPDQTPDDPTDNSVEICKKDYYAEGHALFDPAEVNVWDNACATTAVEGIYIIELSVAGDTYSNNKFSMRTVMGGAVSNNVEMYGFGAISLAMGESNTTPTFQVARIDEIYRGTSLVVGLWDAGDLNAPGVISFHGSLTGIDCSVRELDDHGVVINDWHSDDGGSGCRLDIDIKEHNGEWVEFRFDIPTTFSCGGSCWGTVQYAFGVEPHDRTTWTARIEGGPVHLLP